MWPRARRTRRPEQMILVYVYPAADLANGLVIQIVNAFDNNEDRRKEGTKG